MNDQYFYSLPNCTSSEIIFLKDITRSLDDEALKRFMILYRERRRDPQHILLFTFLGFVGFAGVQRFATGQIVMGVLYFFTAGLCFVGTIIDLINHKSLANEYNHKMAIESRQFSDMMR